MRHPRSLCLCVLGALILATPAVAQSSLSGVVRDTTGAVLPGVNVEAASPVLIEKTRTVVTDGEGRYSIVDLRPGNYTVTFALSGFSAVKREGIEVAANVTVPISADLRVGSLEETRGRATLAGGFSTERSLIVNCDNVDDPNQPTLIANVMTSQLDSCDPRTTGGVPYRTQFKLSGSYSLPFNLQASAAFQHNPGASYRTTYVITRALVPALTPTTQTIALTPQGSEFLSDINQLDLSLIRKFELGGAHLQARIDAFNALDSITIISQRSTQFGAATYLQPADALQPRMFRITIQARW